jgi:deoxyribonuclease V
MAKDPAYSDSRCAEAVEEQRRLRAKVRLEPLPSGLRWVGGADVSSNRFGRTLWGGIVVCDALSNFGVVVQSVVRMEVDVPYIPGLLAFREVPVLEAAWERLARKPEVVLVDAHGLAHPRRFGSASHLGVKLGVPTVGCAKSRLCGEHGEPGAERGSWTPLFLDGEEVGRVVRTRAGVKPVFVSPGHLSDLESAVELVLRCSPRLRIPQPVRLAHEAVNEARRGESQEVRK